MSIFDYLVVALLAITIDHVSAQNYSGGSRGRSALWWLFWLMVIPIALCCCCCWWLWRKFISPKQAQPAVAASGQPGYAGGAPYGDNSNSCCGPSGYGGFPFGRRSVPMQQTPGMSQA
ncbi:hypothetical protein SeMB42_g06223 [Synchytrium endobioticum]|uniref:Cardiolipin synthase N-terminal domain-containing protein n=1 Tax=Synchytrium endobioticum TaxID=286115 RepID=A0A507CJD2_9FUNG|nr:hypothetical protein SeMB42_g06223 [Synchytrium endobioticum]TPX51052.1 hypothetical protein SeLEV6574_g00518 [Synchytrium endobioticum]